MNTVMMIPAETLSMIGNKDRVKHYRECAELMCRACSRKEQVTFRRVFGGWVHIWKKANGHSMCAAEPIWDVIFRDGERAVMDAAAASDGAK